MPATRFNKRDGQAPGPFTLKRKDHTEKALLEHNTMAGKCQRKQLLLPANTRKTNREAQQRFRLKQKVAFHTFQGCQIMGLCLLRLILVMTARAISSCVECLLSILIFK